MNKAPLDNNSSSRLNGASPGDSLRLDIWNATLDTRSVLSAALFSSAFFTELSAPYIAATGMAAGTAYTSAFAIAGATVVMSWVGVSVVLIAIPYALGLLNHSLQSVRDTRDSLEPIQLFITVASGDGVGILIYYANESMASGEHHSYMKDLDYFFEQIPDLEMPAIGDSFNFDSSKTFLDNPLGINYDSSINPIINNYTGESRIRIDSSPHSSHKETYEYSAPGDYPDGSDYSGHA